MSQQFPLINAVAFGKSLFLSLLFLSYITAYAQMDLKNALPDLKLKFSKNKSNIEKADLAITISSFYLTNKVASAKMLDSAMIWIVIADNLSKMSYYSSGIDNSLVGRAKVLLANGKYGQVEKNAIRTSGVNFCRLHLLMGKYLLGKPGENQSELDSAKSQFTEVENYAIKHRMPTLMLTSRIQTYKAMMEGREQEGTLNHYLRQTIILSRHYKNQSIEARILYEKGIYDLNHSASVQSLKKALELAKMTKDTILAVLCLEEISYLDIIQGRVIAAQNQLKLAIKLMSEGRLQNPQYLYENLAALEYKQGNFQVAMDYFLKSVKYAEDSGTEFNVYNIYARLANLCRDMGLRNESSQWYRISIDKYIKTENRFPYVIYRLLAKQLITQGKAKQVLKTLDSVEHIYPHDRDNQLDIQSVKADCYLSLGNPGPAEKCYTQIITILNIKNQKDDYFYSGYRDIAAFYIHQGAFRKAEPYVDVLLTAAPGIMAFTSKASVELYKFKIDSAKGNFLSAIKHFQRSKAITDSVFNQTKLRQTQQLQLQYNTAKRDQENLRLRNKNHLQKSDLEKEYSQKKIISLGLLGCIAFIALLSYLYKAKQQSNIALKQNQQEINAQNEQLGTLLQEKEWLIKEVHHRVKNNLQIIASLLNTQASFLSNEEAKTAIRDSQNRMQAISIVHQKLYQSENLSSVNLKTYIEEISKSIIESFGTNNNIGFVFDVRDEDLSTNESVPLGLILNEAITNSIKYAFPDGYGIICISFKKQLDGWFELIIRDNGKGLPTDFDLESCSSLGVNLIIGLSSQLSGFAKITSDGGTIISVRFPMS